MRCKTFFLSLLISVIANQLNFRIHNSSIIIKKILGYMVQSDINESTIYGENSMVLITDNSTNSKSMIREMAEGLKVPLILLGDYTLISSMKKIRQCLIFILLSDMTKIDRILKNLLEMESFKVYLPVVLVVCEFVKKEEEKYVISLLRRVWNYGIYRFVVIYVSDDIHVKRFNPFLEWIYEVPPNKSVIFEEHLDNLYGYKMRIGIFEEWPIVKKGKNWLTRKTVWIGRDIFLLDIVMKQLNATYEFIEPPKRTRYQGAIKDIRSNKTDMCINRLFQTTKYEGIEYSDFNDIAYLHVLVPRPDKLSPGKALLKILQKDVWIASAFSLLALGAFTKILIHVKGIIFNSSLSLLDIWSIFLATTANRIHYKVLVSRLALTFCIWGYFILNISFQSKLTNMLQFIEYEKGVTNLQELNDSNITIFSSYNMTKLTGNPQLLVGHLRHINYTDLQRLLWYEKLKAAFVVSFATIRSHTNPDLFPKNGTVSHLLLPDPLCHSYSVYLFRGHSPFSRRYGMVILKLNQFGFVSKIQQIVRVFEREDRGLGKLTLDQVEAAFLILGYGLIICLIMLLAEFTFHPSR